MRSNQIAKYFLRAGLAFVFIYATIEIYLAPHNFIKYVPVFMMDLVPVNLFLPAFGVIELLLAFWLLSGWKGAYPSFISFCMMAGIVACNMEYFNVLFRNVAIGFGSLALVALELTKEKTSKKLA
jgi:hypothetical protein